MKTRWKLLSGVLVTALLLPLGAGCSTKGTGETGSPEETTVTEQVEGEVFTSELPFSVVVTWDEAVEVYGVGDSGPEGAPDAYIVGSDDQGMPWIPLFEDETAFKEKLLNVLSRSVEERKQKAEQGNSDPMTIRFSQFSRAEVENAMETIGDVDYDPSVGFSYSYDPYLDAIRVICNPASCAAIADEAGGVPVIKDAGETSSAK